MGTLPNVQPIFLAVASLMPLNTDDILKAISNPTRREILHWLREPARHFADYPHLLDPQQDGVCASFIQDKTALSQPTISSHLNKLHKAGLLTSKKVATWTYYKRNESVIAEFLRELEQSL
ncbi:MULTISPECIES: ArsR/SmtB family transcription factor [Enterobacteriaceae]|nr:transcriptional regulator [Klebsiella sp. WP7-S18-CRE-02]BBS97442.1 transcriptional regulator [Klebsiella sp. WP7-S18-CRE-03]BBT02509.1 transcriptional regulator [Klebsiella sp. WP7-S18-ESBL-04]BBT71699.1 transcriptional regulator [Klebsiella sp. WP8-S18-ESBL-06]